MAVVFGMDTAIWNGSSITNIGTTSPVPRAPLDTVHGTEKGENRRKWRPRGGKQWESHRRGSVSHLNVCFIVDLRETSPRRKARAGYPKELLPCTLNILGSTMKLNPPQRSCLPLSEGQKQFRDGHRTIRVNCEHNRCG